MKYKSKGLFPCEKNTLVVVRKQLIKKITCLSLAIGLAGTALSAQALTITPTFGSGFDSAAQTTVNQAINFFHSRISDNVNLKIKFVNSGSGLGSSSQSVFVFNYGNYLNALKNDSNSANDTIALSHLPSTSSPVNSTPSPVPGTSNTILLTRGNAVAVGLDTTGISVPDGSSSWDATISLNLNNTNFNRTSIDLNKYDLQNVAMHEIDEVLGNGSWLGQTDTSFFSPMDLFRYTSGGTRTYTTTGDNAYFSIDGGTTQLVQFNQDSTGDYGDYHTGSGVHVQNAFGTRGVYTTNMTTELTGLDVIGYNLTPVPLPPAFWLMFSGLGLLTSLRKRCSS